MSDPEIKALAGRLIEAIKSRPHSYGFGNFVVLLMILFTLSDIAKYLKVIAEACK